MKKIFTILTTIFLTVINYAQEKTEVMCYNFSAKMVLDKTQPATKTEKGFVLDINAKQESRFAELDFLKRTQAAKEQKNKPKGPDISKVLSIRPQTSFIVFSNDKKLTTYTKEAKTVYTYDEDGATIVWKIEPETSKWNDFLVQKATTFFEGRHWNVLFTKDISINEGPYKFKNLPGFVVKAWDDENHYEFEFLNSEKVEVTDWEFSDAYALTEKITKEQYEKLLKVKMNKTYRDELVENIPTNANNNSLPAGFNEKIGLRSNPILKVE